jgi:hypothetical protein
MYAINTPRYLAYIRQEVCIATRKHDSERDGVCYFQIIEPFSNHCVYHVSPSSSVLLAGLFFLYLEAPLAASPPLKLPQ